MADSVHYEKGTKLARELFGGELGQFANTPTLGVDDDFPKEAASYLYGYLMQGRPGLSDRFRLLSAIGMLTALARTEMLATWIKAGLKAGITKEEIREVILTMSIYAGWPVAESGLKVAAEVFESA